LEKIVVLGSSGLIGSAFLRLYEKLGIDILSPKRSELDLELQAETLKYFHITRPDLIIMAAGRTGGIRENIEHPYQLIHSNIQMASNVISAANEVCTSRVILFGSSCMYPKDAPQPMQENLLGTGPLEQTSQDYAVAKQCTIRMGLAFNKETKTSRYLCVIPNSVYGPNDKFDETKSHVLSALIKKIYNARLNQQDAVELWGSGEVKREFIHSDDVASAVMHLTRNKKFASNQPINIGIGSDLSIKQLAQIIAAEIGYRGKIIWNSSKPDGAKQKLLDSSKLFSSGWYPKFTLKQGIRDTVEWYVSSQEKPIQ
jgi:GDP-L-fucose synthase